MKTPLATLTLLGDATGGTPLFKHSPEASGGLFAELFNAQMADGINGVRQELPPARNPLGAASISAVDVQALGALNARAFLPMPAQILSGSVSYASETPEYPVQTDSEAAIPVVGNWQHASQEIDSGTPDVSQVQEETLSPIVDAQLVETGTTGNAQAEEDTMNTPAVQTTQASSAQNTVRQKQSDSFITETSFDRVLDQQVANRHQEQKSLDRQASERRQERSDKTDNDADNRTESTDAELQARARMAQQAGVVELDVSAAMQHAMTLAEAMRPSRLPDSELPANAVRIGQGDGALAATTGDKPAITGTAIPGNDQHAGGISPVSATGEPLSAANDAVAAAPTQADAAGAIKLAGVGTTADTDAASQALPAHQAAREAASAKSGTTAASAKDPVQSPTAAMFNAQQAKAETNSGSSQDAQQFAGAQTRTPTTEIAAKDSFTSAFGTVITAAVPATINGMPQALSGLHGATTPGNAARLSPQVGHPGWNQALGQHMVMMAGNAQQTATLTLNPPDLGPLQVVLQVQNSQADATFITAQPDVKQALEAALPRLREMMEQAGIELGQATVNTGTPQQQHAQQQHSNGQSAHVNAFAADSEETAPMLAALPTVGSNGRGIVDIFA